MKNKSILILILVLIVAKWLVFPPQTNTTPSSNPANNTQQVQAAYQNRQSNVQVSGTGTVSKILPDDNKGSRHQRFILRLAHGQTLLVAHNIDLAPKITNLKTGDTVDFYGEYEYNEQGGVLHWTHHDPAQRHAHGWLKHQNQIYQ